MSEITFKMLEIGDRLVIQSQTKDDKTGKIETSFYTGEVESLNPKTKKITFLYDEKLEGGEDQTRGLKLENIIGWANKIENPNEMGSSKGYGKFLLDEKPGSSEDEKPAEIVETVRKSTVATSKPKPGAVTKPKPGSDTGPDQSRIPEFNLKTAKVGDRILVDHWFDSKFVVKEGYYKGKITDLPGEDGLVGIFYDSGGEDADGWVKSEWVVGEATDKIHGKQINSAKILQHLVGEDGKPLEAPADNPFNNGARFDVLEAQIAELKEMLEKMNKLLTGKKKAE